MQERLVYVGIFWAVPADNGDWNFYEIKKTYPEDKANSLGFIDYPYSHYDKWDDVRSADETDDCYYYPRGRVLFNVNTGKHRIFADECLDEYSLSEIIEMFEIEDFELCRDEHYVSAFSKPTLSYNILRGKDKIGENLIEISYDKTKILVELGKALDGGDGLSETERQAVDTKYNGVIISHYHADHAGLIDLTESPVYMGVKTKKIVEELNTYLGKKPVHDYRPYSGNRPFFIGGIKITPYLCDHSAFDSYMLLFEAGGKSILYTGDFRFHGRKSSEKLINAIPKNVDVLLYDGTNIGLDKPCITEQQLETQARAAFKGAAGKPVFIFQSTTNIDRLVTFYRASTKCGRPLYMDDFQCAIAKAAGGKIPRPDEFKNVYAFTFTPLDGERYETFKAYRQKLSIDKIARQKNFTMLVRQSSVNYLKSLAKRMDLSGALFVYSMWNGYKKDEKMQRFLNTIKDLGMETVTLHTSGHATAQEIEQFISEINPKQAIVVHTNA